MSVILATASRSKHNQDGLRMSLTPDAEVRSKIMFSLLLRTIFTRNVLEMQLRLYLNTFLRSRTRIFFCLVLQFFKSCMLRYSYFVNMDQQSSLARFIQYHTTNYDADVIHAASILWNSKTAGQMDEWIAFYNTAEAANTTANNHHTIALHRYEVVSNIVQKAVDHPLNADESNRLLGFVDLAIASFQDYQGSAAEAVQAWAQLQHAERTHPITGGLPDQAQGQINIQNEQMGHIPQAIQTFRQIRAYPPVRHDPAGHERIVRTNHSGYGEGLRTDEKTARGVGRI